MRSPRTAVICATVGGILLGQVAVAAAGPGGWVVAMPPFAPRGGRIVANTSAPLATWVREGDFANRAECERALGDEFTRAASALQIARGFDDERLTEDLQEQVIEAVRQARCIRAD